MSLGAVSSPGGALLKCGYCGRACPKFWRMRSTLFGGEAAMSIAQKIRAHEPYPAGIPGDESIVGRIVLAVRNKRGSVSGTIEVWLGEYRCHGWADAPFCTVGCLEGFATACYRAGMRVKDKPKG